MNKWDEQKRQGHSPLGQPKLTPAQQSIIDSIPLKREPTTLERVKAAGHQHGEAFCLMEYVCTGTVDYSRGALAGGRLPRTAGCGHREIYWNSRDGVTPFGMQCPSCGGDLNHMNWNRDVYAPDHKPHQGQGIWRDGTPDEAERFMRWRIAQSKGTEYEVTPEREAKLIEYARNPPEGEPSEFQRGWPMFYRHDVTKELE